MLNNDTEVTPGWVEAGLAPFANPTVGSVAPLVLVRSDPSRVDSAGDGYHAFGWPIKRGHGQPATRWADHPIDRVFGASGSCAFYRAEALLRVGAFDPSFGSYYEDVDLAFRLRWAGYDCVFTPHCRILHEVSASYDHARPAPPASDGAERGGPVLDRSAGLLAPRRARPASRVHNRAGPLATRPRPGAPFLLGKLDAVREWPGLRQRRELRTHLARSSIATPHFPIQLGLLEDVRNHLRRPREVSAECKGQSL